jgi:8-oxo-dGTP pyrophosphatase MutT (NUDIX family)
MSLHSDPPVRRKDSTRSRNPRPFASLEAHPLGRSPRPKHLVVTAYIIRKDQVLLLRHRKLRRWLPPGGHVEATEDPLRALIREVYEETGYLVRPWPVRDPRGDEPGVLVLPAPHHIQVETIDARHEHINLIYPCEVVAGDLHPNAESREVRWVSREALDDLPLGANVRHFAGIFLEAASRTRRPSPQEGDPERGVLPEDSSRVSNRR